MRDRRSIRLKEFDYAQEGSYFITLCTINRVHLFGEIIQGKMNPNPFGELAKSEWLNTPILRPNTALDEFIIMPDHFHAILSIKESVRAYLPHDNSVRAYCNTPQFSNSAQEESFLANISSEENCPSEQSFRANSSSEQSVRAYCNTPQRFKSPSQTIGAIIRGYKAALTKQINILRNTPGQPIWQRNYFEHIIRSEEELIRIQKYIIYTPRNWEKNLTLS